MSNTTEREAFEADYAKVWNEANNAVGWKSDHTGADVEKLRDGDSYGEDRTYLNARWEGWQARAALSAASGQSAEAAGEPVGQSVTLTVAQLLEAFQYATPYYPNDADQLECELTIQHGNGYSGAGMYCWFTEYPEEGSILLNGTTCTTPPAAGEKGAREVIRELQKALFYWMPSIAGEDSPAGQKAAEHAYLLYGVQDYSAECEGDRLMQSLRIRNQALERIELACQDAGCPEGMEFEDFIASLAHDDSGRKLTHKQARVIERAINYFETVVRPVPDGILSDLRALLAANASQGGA